MVKQGTILLTSEWYLKCQQLTHALNVISEAHGLSYDQFLVLEQVVELGINTPGQIAEVFRTSAPAASRKLNTLQTKKFVTKIRDMDNDQRTVWIEATDLGLKAYQAVKSEIQNSGVQLVQADVDTIIEMKKMLSR